MSPFAKIVRRHLQRRPGRTLLTVLGVASAMLLLVCIESLSNGLDRALSSGDAARTLIVYRLNRYCPQTSLLPERYTSRIEEVPGVTRVLPVKVHLSNCRASLDVVAFQGAPVDRLLKARPLELESGDLNRFQTQKDAALVGRAFAARRGLSPGDSFRFGNIAVDVAGIFRSADPVNEALILTHLEFLQRASSVDRLGIVTQFEVQIDDAGNSRRIASEIDALFANAEEPTNTRPSTAFLEDATRELGEILSFGRVFGLVCVLVVLVLVANTVLMALEERRSEFGVYLTLGYGGRHLLGLVLFETLLLTLTGAVLGLAGAFLLIRFSHLSIGVEGVTVSFSLAPGVFLRGLLIALAAGTVASVLPAVRAARSNVLYLLRGA